MLKSIMTSLFGKKHSRRNKATSAMAAEVCNLETREMLSAVTTTLAVAPQTVGQVESSTMTRVQIQGSGTMQSIEWRPAAGTSFRYTNFVLRADLDGRPGYETVIQDVNKDNVAKFTFGTGKAIPPNGSIWVTAAVAGNAPNHRVGFGSPTMRATTPVTYRGVTNPVNTFRIVPLNVTNVNPDANGTRLAVGGKKIGAFRFSSASTGVKIDSLSFIIDSTNVLFDRQFSLFRDGLVVNSTSVTTLNSRQIRVTFGNLRAFNSGIAAGKSMTLALQINKITDPAFKPVASQLQVSLELNNLRWRSILGGHTTSYVGLDRPGTVVSTLYR